MWWPPRNRVFNTWFISQERKIKKQESRKNQKIKSEKTKEKTLLRYFSSKYDTVWKNQKIKSEKTKEKTLLRYFSSKYNTVWKSHRIHRPKKSSDPTLFLTDRSPLASDPSYATQAVQPRLRGPSSATQMRWALSPQILSLFDLMGFEVFIFLIWILGGCWGWIWLN